MFGLGLHELRWLVVQELGFAMLDLRARQFFVELAWSFRCLGKKRWFTRSDHGADLRGFNHLGASLM